MPAKSEIDKIVQRYKKEGFNAMRIISYERPLNTPNTYTVTYKQQGILNTDYTINTTALDVLDYFIHKAQQNGIYIQLVVHMPNTGVPGYTDCIDECRGVDMYMPGMVQVQKDLASTLLNHVNPYSGRAYKNDPGIIALELHNESSMNTSWSNGKFDTYVSSSTLYAKYIRPLEDMWEVRAQAKYGTVAALNTAWSGSYSAFSDISVPTLATSNSINVQMYKDWIDFIYSVEKNYKEEMYNYYRNTIGVKNTLIYDTQADYNVPWVREKMDVTDLHSYFGDLGVPTGQLNPSNNRPVTKIENKSILHASGDLVNVNVIGANYKFELKDPTKPNFVTEYAYRDGNQYMAEQEPFAMNYFGFQDLDAVFLFDYHDSNMTSQTNTYGARFNNTALSLTRPMSAIMFRRGDVTPGAKQVLKQTKEAYLNAMVTDPFTKAPRTSRKSTAGILDFAGQSRARITHNVYHQVANTTSESQNVTVGSRPANDIWVTSTGEMTWKPLDRVTLNAPKTKSAIGFFNNTTLNLGSGAEITIGDTMNDYAIVGLTSLNDTEVLPSGKMLLTLAGHFTVPGEWPRTPGQNTYSWGNDAARIEAVPSKVKITTTNDYKVTALDSTGARKMDVPVIKGSGYIEFVTGPAYDTGWYLIEKK